jgi:sulfite oxidase
VGVEGSDLKSFSLADVKNYAERDMAVTLMCTGNRRSEFNTEKEGETMGLPWKNGSISTARWSGCSLLQVMKDAGIDWDLYDKGFRFLTLYGVEDYHISVPLRKALDREGDCMLAWKMNGEELPRDHGYPLRVLIPGFVGARSVKWIGRIVAMKNECEGMHQLGIAYKQLAPNQKLLSSVSREHIESLPPIDHVPVTSAITCPNPGTTVAPGQSLDLQGYAYSGAGLCVIRVDVSVDGGETWDQATLERPDDTQFSRSGRAWAWVQWKMTVTIPKTAKGAFSIVCKAVDDQYNQQPHASSAIWNLRGILNTSWGQVPVVCGEQGMQISAAARSGDGTTVNVGIKMSGTHSCSECRQKFDTEKARDLHWKFIHDPNRHQED